MSTINQATTEKYSVGSANVIKNITQEVIRDCAKIDIHVEEHVVSLAVRLLSLDPSYGLRLDSNFDRHSLEEFVNKCVAKFRDHSNSSVKALNMQVFCMDHAINTDRISQQHDELMKVKTYKLTEEIISADNTIKDRDKLFKKLIIDVIVNNSLGNPMSSKINQDVLNILKSVMSKEDAATFMALKRAERYDSLLNLREIVSGIYIFNKDSGLCGEGGIDVEPLILSGYTTTKSQLNISLNEIKNRIDLLASALNQYITDDDNETHINIEEELEDDYELLKNVLILHRQHDFYVKSLNKSLTKLKVDIDHCLKIFKEKIKNIHEVVKFRTAIPTDKIFPRFTDLAHCFQRMQNQIYVLSELNVVNEKLMQLTEEIRPWEDLAFSMLGDIFIESDESRLKKGNTARINVSEEDIKVIEYTSKLKIEYLGFCTMTLVEGRGLLIPANFSIGICNYKGKNYAFRTRTAAVHFQSNPDKYIFGVIEVCRTHPELIAFLDVFDDVKLFRDDYHRVQSNVVQRVTHDVDIQTDMHPVPTNLDKEYTWNIWDFRRKAIQLANLRNSKTSSTQTSVMYQRFGVNTQTTSPRNCASQTRKDECVLAPKPTKDMLMIRGERRDSCN